MGARLRLTLLIVIGILGDIPISRAPGFSSTLAGVAQCPQCGKDSTRKSGNRYWCRTHGWFVPPPAPAPTETPTPAPTETPASTTTAEPEQN